ncbi:MAG: VOC family protein [Nocardioides sp.]
MTAARVVKLGHVLVPGDDLDDAARFWVDRLGLELRFRDGDRYLAVTDGRTTLGLAAPEEQPAPGVVAVSVQVAGLDDLLLDWAADGLDVGPVQEGPHERRALVHDPAGNLVVVYEVRE